MDYIPIVDIGPILEHSTHKPSENDWSLVAKQVGNAMSKVGFVYLINHGVDDKKINDAFAESRTFYSLPVETKRKYQKNTKISFSGYAEPGQEILDAEAVSELRESFDIKNSADEQFLKIEEVPAFITKLRSLEYECIPLVHKILKIFARALELENEDFFIQNSQYLSNPNVSSYTTFRTIYYPPIPKELQITPGTVRCAPHSDYGILTLLFQDDIGGLEVKTVENTWVPAKPIPGSILINTGDLLEFWSAGQFPATQHRVLIPETELKRGQGRQSIVYFIHPDDQTIVAPLKKTGTQFEPVSAYDHAKMKLDRSYKY